MVREKDFISKFIGVAVYFSVFLYVLTILYPFIYMFSVSISDPVEVGYLRVKFLPRGEINFNAYKQVLNDLTLLRSYFNSVLYTLVGTMLTILFSSLGAYVLSRKKFRLRKFLSVVFVFTMYFNGGLIPTYLNISNLGLMDTIWAIVLPPSFAMWYIIVMRTNFTQIPEDLFNAAYIDGANDWYIYSRIILPLSKPIIATIGVWASIRFWNDFFGPLLYLPSPEKQTLTILLRRILVARAAFESGETAVNSLVEGGDMIAAQGIYQSIRMAVVFVTIGPIILAYPFAQKYFTKGALVGSIKA